MYFPPSTIQRYLNPSFENNSNTNSIGAFLLSAIGPYVSYLKAEEPDRCMDEDPLVMFAGRRRECILHLSFPEEDLTCTLHFHLQFDLISSRRKEDT